MHVGTGRPLALRVTHDLVRIEVDEADSNYALTGMVENSVDAAAIERILAAVGAKFILANLDKLKLGKDLASCFTVYSSAVQRSSDKPTKDRIHRLKSIQEAAKRLEEQLVPDDVWDWSDRYRECEYLQSEVQHLIKELDSEIEDLTFELEWGPDWREAIRLGVSPRTLADRWKARSPFEWVAGHCLPEVFRTHFGTTATFHRRKGVPDSPAIRFIEQALTELGITKSGRPYSREYIAKAIGNVRTSSSE
jgi:hypothetical protein